MKVEQIKDIVNTVNAQVLGKSFIENLDVQNLVETGQTLASLAQKTPNLYDNYISALVDATAKYVFVNRVYGRRAPNVLKDNWEYGSIVRKIRMKKLPKARNNEVWGLKDGQVYEEHQFFQPKIVETLFDNLTTFEVPMSYTKKQVESAFTSLEEFNRLIGMIETSIYNKLNVDADALIMLTISNMASLTIEDDYSDDYGTASLSSRSGVKAVNLLFLYNVGKTVQLTPEEALNDKNFLRFAIMTMKNYSAQMEEMTSIYNIEKADRFTPKNLQHFIVLSQFINAVNIVLQSETYHNEFLKFDYYDEITKWQGVGTDFSLHSVSTIDIINSNGTEIHIPYVIGAIFDHDALGVSMADEYVETSYTKSARFWTSYYKRDARYFNALDEQFVLFFLA